MIELEYTSIYYFLILAWLGYMAYLDIKTRSVSNSCILAFYVIILPAVTMNVHNFTIYHAVIVFAVIALYLARIGMGGADMKVLVPLILTLNEGMMYLFIYVMLIFSFILIVEKQINRLLRSIPGMVAIFAGYMVVFLFFETGLL